MLDIKLIRENPDKVKAAMKTRNKDMDAVVDEILAIDKQVRELTQKADALKAEQNAASKQIPQIKKEGGDISEIMARMNAIKEEVKVLDADKAELAAKQKTMMYEFPTYPAIRHLSVRTTAKTLKSVSSVNPDSLTLSPRLTGISAQISAFSIPKLLQR